MSGPFVSHHVASILMVIFQKPVRSQKRKHKDRLAAVTPKSDHVF